MVVALFVPVLVEISGCLSSFLVLCGVAVGFCWCGYGGVRPRPCRNVLLQLVVGVKCGLLWLNGFVGSGLLVVRAM